MKYIQKYEGFFDKMPGQQKLERDFNIIITDLNPDNIENININ